MAKKPKEKKMTDLERKFLTRWIQIAPYGTPEPIFQCPFDDTARRFDFGWPEYKIAVEMQGGIWNGGAHGRGSGIVRDYIKNNDAAVLGWRVIYISVDMIDRDAITCVNWVLNCFYSGLPLRADGSLSADPESP